MLLLANQQQQSLDKTFIFRALHIGDCFKQTNELFNQPSDKYTAFNRLKPAHEIQYIGALAQIVDMQSFLEHS